MRVRRGQKTDELHNISCKEQGTFPYGKFMPNVITITETSKISEVLLRCRKRWTN
jgi:hypothetical protein